MSEESKKVCLYLQEKDAKVLLEHVRRDRDRREGDRGLSMEVLQAYDRLEMELGHQTLGPSDGEVEDLKNLLGIAVRQHDPGTGWMLCMMTPSWVEYASALSGVKPIGHRRDYIEHVIDSLRKTLKE